MQVLNQTLLYTRYASSSRLFILMITIERDWSGNGTIENAWARNGTIENACARNGTVEGIENGLTTGGNSIIFYPL